MQSTVKYLMIALNMNRKIRFSKNDLHIKCNPNTNMEEQQDEKDITKETLKPITKVKSKVDKELQEQEVESTGGGMGAGGG
jgi:hypothetical protein